MPATNQRNPRPLDMENFEIWVQGYYLPLVIACSVDTRESARMYHPYGRDGEYTYIELAGGSVSMSYLHDDDMKVMADILTNQDPDTADEMQVYYPEDDVFSHVVRLLKSEDEKRYVRAEFYKDWHTTLQPVNGAPGNYGEVSQDGECDIPVAFTSNSANKGVAILTDVVPLTDALTYAGESGRTGNFNFYKPSQIPNAAKGYLNAGKYALHVELQRRDSATDTLSDPRTQCKSMRIRQNMIQIVSTNSLAPPTVAAAKSTEAASKLEAGRYWYRVTSLDSSGESNSSASFAPESAGSPVDTAAGEKNTVTITKVTGAKSYNIYRAKVAAAGAAPAADTAYGYLTTVVDDGGAGPFVYNDLSKSVDMLNTSPGTTNNATNNTTGQGLGRVFISDKDMKGTGWTLSDAGVHYFAFIHYLYNYDVVGADPMLIGDGLSALARWQIPDGSITWS